ncbi:MAG: DUF308 domain-containing protein [Coriobacteriia bacterium]|nr:DUF308 domain-containing protein [Coriobacteriia bacterium]
MAIEIWVRSTEALKRRGWGFVARGLVFAAFGVAVLVWPALTGTVLVTLIGAVILLAGLVLLYGAFRLRDLVGGTWLAAALPASTVAVFGLVVLAFPHAVSSVLLVILAAFAVLAGIADIASSLALATVVGWWWLRLLRGLLLTGAGVWLIFADVSGLVAIGVLVGVWALMLGGLTVAFGLLALRS